MIATEPNTRYVSPLSSRYADREMERLFSPQFKFETWRRLWIVLAEGEKELGLNITDQQIQKMNREVSNIDFERVDQIEGELHHDVMAHIKAFGEVCPMAAPIIHLGATSCYVTDNTDTIQIKQAVSHLIPKLIQVIEQLSDFACRYRDLPCLGFTHFQSAQPTTVGKRACLWLQDLVWDYEELNRLKKELKFLGVKGATGTQASFLSLFQGDVEKVERLDRIVAEKMGFDQVFTITGQTYTRKQDIQILNVLASFGATVHKMATDIRLLAHLKEVEEGFGKKQVGSSAMPYKRNPILSERLCSLSRFLISLSQNPLYTHATQWLERSLDDSANRRITLSEAFLTADALLNALVKVTKELKVNEKVVEKRLKEELPFIAAENLLMKAVKKGGDRQELHEKLRQHTQAAANRLKEGYQEHHLTERIAQDTAFSLTKEEIGDTLDIRAFTGLAPRQVDRFLSEVSEKIKDASHNERWK